MLKQKIWLQYVFVIFPYKLLLRCCFVRMPILLAPSMTRICMSVKEHFVQTALVYILFTNIWILKLYDIKHSLFSVSRWSWCLDGRLHLCRARMAMEVLVPNVLSAPGSQSSFQYWKVFLLAIGSLPMKYQKQFRKYRGKMDMKIYENIDKLHVWCLLHWPIRGVVAATVWLGPTQFLRQRPCF